MDVNVNTSGEITVIEIVGELDTTTAYNVQSQILPLAEKSHKILLDMSGITYMSSAGLRILLTLYRSIKERHGEIVLVGLNEDIKDIMSITGFLDFFTTFDNREDGLKSLRTH